MCAILIMQKHISFNTCGSMWCYYNFLYNSRNVLKGNDFFCQRQLIDLGWYKTLKHVLKSIKGTKNSDD